MSKFFVLWILWSLFGAALVFFAADSKNTTWTTVGEVVSLAPLIGFLLALGSEKTSGFFHAWIRNNKNSLYYLVAGMAALFAVPGMLTWTFNPYNTVIFAAMVAAVFGSLQQLRSGEFMLSWTDVALWILLWIPFDLRWSTDMQPHVGYAWWSIAISLVAVIGWRGYREAGIGFNLVPKWKDLYIALIALFAIMAVVIPPGLLTGFLKFAIPSTFNITKQATGFIGLFLTVAVPEELFFRGILYRGLLKVSSKKWVPMVVSSLAFGLMHWNNIGGLDMQITYVSLAAIAGFGYAWAYKRSGNNLLAAILTHTLVDWTWKLVLAG